MENTDFSGATDIIVVKATLKLLTTDESGRLTPVRTGYRPNHVFEYKDKMVVQSFIGEIQFDGIAEIQPGEEYAVTVNFLRVPEILQYIAINRQWWIHEGRRVVGTGEIVLCQSE